MSDNAPQRIRQRAALAVAEELPGNARFRSVEATGMGRNDYLSAAQIGLIAFDAIEAAGFKIVETNDG